MLSWVEIDLGAIRFNIESIKRKLDKSIMFMPIVKANAYGHGTYEVAKAIEDLADWFGVVNGLEAEGLKKIGIKKPILILGYDEPDRIEKAIDAGISFSVFNLADLKRADAYAGGVNKKAKVHIKFDTGINRLGFSYDDIEKTIKEIKESKDIIVEGILSHLASVEEVDIKYTRRQIDLFEEIKNEFIKAGIKPKIAHISASAASLILHDVGHELVRSGIMVYGLWPSEETKLVLQRQDEESNFKIIPALAWKTKLISIKNVKQGNCVGYGCTYKVSRDMKVGVIPVGYAEGLDRGLSNNGEVLVGGKRCAIVGRVCMNMTMIDVSGVDAKRFDEVVIIGQQEKEEITADEMAERLDTINYEIVSRIPYTIPRIYIN